MSDPTKKRRFWQLHLSTAVLLLLISGVILGANANIVTGIANRANRDPMDTQQYGWPIPVFFFWNDELYLKNVFSIPSDYRCWPSGCGSMYPLGTIAFDIFLWICMLSVPLACQRISHPWYKCHIITEFVVGLSAAFFVCLNIYPTKCIFGKKLYEYYGWPETTFMNERGKSASSVAVNLLVFFLCEYFVWQLSECLLRRREGREQ
jgi:hypothetical protein